MSIIGTYTVIGDVGATLLKLLRDNMTPEPIPKPELIGMCSPADKGDFRLTLYLYSIKEDEELRNRPSRHYSPLAFNLYYLLTAYSATDLKYRAMDEQYIMGSAMQVFYYNAVLRGSVLQGSLIEKDEEIRIRHNFLSTDEMSKIWTFPEVPYRLSVGYIVGPVSIDPKNEIKAGRVMK